MTMELQVLEESQAIHTSCEHVAIIMDGNRRWAKERNLPGSAGHWKGAETFFNIVEIASEMHIKTLTAYTFSSENWKRPEEEVQSIMELLEVQLVKERKRLCDNGIRLSTIGNLAGFPLCVLDALQDTIEATKKGKKMELVLALGYGSRDEICRAMNGILKDYSEGKLPTKKITEEMISSYLDTSQRKDPDLLIRTGGSQRLSNFLLWQIAYTEVLISEVLWPDFSKHDFIRALADFQSRTRRFGK